MAGKHMWQLISKLSASSHSLKFGPRTFFFPNEGIPARTAIRTIGLFLPASSFCAGQFQLEGALFRLLCHAWLESKVQEKNGGANSKVSEAREKRDQNPISHYVSFANTES